MPNYHYVQYVGGEEHWSAIPVSQRYHVETEERPTYMTVLAVSKLVEDLPHDEKMKLTYSGPLYFDWDSVDETLVIEKVNQFLDKFEEMGFDLAMCRLYATGGKGYHMEVPMTCFMEKVRMPLQRTSWMRRWCRCRPLGSQANSAPCSCGARRVMPEMVMPADLSRRRKR